MERISSLLCRWKDFFLNSYNVKPSTHKLIESSVHLFIAWIVKQTNKHSLGLFPSRTRKIVLSDKHIDGEKKEKAEIKSRRRTQLLYCEIESATEHYSTSFLCISFELTACCDSGEIEAEGNEWKFMQHKDCEN